MPKPNLSLLDPHQQECAKLMRENSHRHRLHEVFRDFCELSALAISNAVDKLQFDVREALSRHREALRAGRGGPLRADAGLHHDVA